MKRKGSDYFSFFPEVRGEQQVVQVPGGWLVDYRVLHVDPPRSRLVCGVEKPTLVSGFRWLYLVPQNARYALLAILNGEGRPEWLYTDICAGSGIDEAGQPWTDDLYLDVVALCRVEANGRWHVTNTEIIDVHELDAALNAGHITPAQHALAWAQAREVEAALRAQTFAPVDEIRTYLAAPYT